MRKELYGVDKKWVRSYSLSRRRKRRREKKVVMLYVVYRGAAEAAAGAEMSEAPI